MPLTPTVTQARDRLIALVGAVVWNPTDWTTEDATDEAGQAVDALVAAIRHDERQEREGTP